MQQCFLRKSFLACFFIDIRSGSGFADGWVIAPCCNQCHCCYYFYHMRKKPPGEKNISTGVSLPPDLYDWVVSRANEPSHDPTLSRSTSRIVKQALVEYRDRIEAEEREMALRAAETPERVAPAKKNKVEKYLTAAERKRANLPTAAGAGTINISSTPTAPGATSA